MTLSEALTAKANAMVAVAILDAEIKKLQGKESKPKRDVSGIAARERSKSMRKFLKSA